MSGFDRRSFNKGIAATVLTGATGNLLYSTKAEAIIWGLIGRALLGFAGRTVARNTVRRALTSLPRAVARRGRSAISRTGYNRHRTIVSGSYRGSQKRWSNKYIPEASGVIAEELIRTSLRPGYAMEGGLGHPFGDDGPRDFGYGAFPNYRYDDTPVLGCPDLFAMYSAANYIKMRIGLRPHESTIMIYPLSMSEYPKYDGGWNSYRPAVYKSPNADIRITAQRMGTVDASVDIRIVLFGSRTTFYEEAIPMPPLFQRRFG